MVFTIPEVAEMLKASVYRVKLLIKSGKLSFIRVGKAYRVTQEALTAFLKGGQP